MARSTPKRKREGDEDIIRTEKKIRLQDDQAAFQGFDADIEPDKDYISEMPSEILDNVLSYCLLDHDPDRGARGHVEGVKTKPLPPALLSLAAMSKRFHDLVENFSHRYIIKHDLEEHWIYKAIVDGVPRGRVQKVGTRRSSRLAEAVASSSPTEPAKPALRRVVVRHMRTYCIGCDKVADDATVANHAACCAKCELKIFGGTINLSDAMKDYDLRDYMLLKSRQPGPRAKHTNLPPIPYAAVYKSRGYPYGWGMTYLFYDRQVETLAKVVHGDVDKHMEQKATRLRERKENRLRKLHIELKIRYHAAALGRTIDRKEQQKHRERLQEFKDPAWDGQWKAAIERGRYSDQDYGNYDDVHERICKIDRRSCCRKKKRKPGLCPCGCEDYDYWSDGW